jgi:hypothetical protein
MEAELDKHGDFAERSFPEYKPHATLAYVNPESARKYEGMADTDGKKFTVKSVSISSRDGSQVEVPLQGTAVVSQTGKNIQNVQNTQKSANSPSSAPQRWRAGKQATPVEVQHPDGNWENGTLRHWSPGYNGLPAQGRVETASGKMLRGVGAKALRPAGNREQGTGPETTNLKPDTSKSGGRPIGAPIEGEIAQMVRERVAAGRPVKIFSRRPSAGDSSTERKKIGDWTEQHFGKRLPVTDRKDVADGAIYDDSSNVEHNTGRILAHTSNPGDQGKPILVDLDGTLAHDDENHSGAAQRERRSKLAGKWRTLRTWRTG